MVTSLFDSYANYWVGLCPSPDHSDPIIRSFTTTATVIFVVFAIINIVGDNDE